jgi:hypothetical protein
MHMHLQQVGQWSGPQQDGWELRCEMPLPVGQVIRLPETRRGRAREM